MFHNISLCPNLYNCSGHILLHNPSPVSRRQGEITPTCFCLLFLPESGTDSVSPSKFLDPKAPKKSGWFAQHADSLQLLLKVVGLGWSHPAGTGGWLQKVPGWIGRLRRFVSVPDCSDAGRWTNAAIMVCNFSSCYVVMNQASKVVKVGR